MKSKWIWIVVILLLLVAGGYAAYRFLYRKGEERLAEFKLDRMVLTEFAFKGDAMIMGGKAELNEALPGKDVIDIGQIKTNALLEGKLPMRMEVRPYENLQGFYFTSQVDASKFIALIRELQKEDSLEVRVSAQIPIHVPVAGNQTLTLSPQSLRVPNFKFPIVKLGMPAIEKLGLKKSRLRLPVYFKNLEEADIRIRGLAMRLDAPDAFTSEINQKDPFKLKPLGSDTLMLEQELQLKKPLEMMVKVVKDDDSYMTDITGKLDMAVYQDGKTIAIPIQIKDRQRVELWPSKEKRQEIKEMGLIRK